METAATYAKRANEAVQNAKEIPDEDSVKRDDLYMEAFIWSNLAIASAVDDVHALLDRRFING